MLAEHTWHEAQVWQEFGHLNDNIADAYNQAAEVQEYKKKLTVLLATQCPSCM